MIKFDISRWSQGNKLFCQFDERHKQNKKKPTDLFEVQTWFCFYIDKKKEITTVNVLLFCFLIVRYKNTGYRTFIIASIHSFMYFTMVLWYKSDVNIWKKKNVARTREKRKRTRTIATLSLPRSSSSASNQSTDRSCSVAMTNVTHTTIFRLRRSDTPTSQNQSIYTHFLSLFC